MIDRKLLEQINEGFISSMFSTYKTILEKFFDKAEEINSITEDDFRVLLKSVLKENSSLVVEAVISEAKTIKDAVDDLKDDEEENEDEKTATDEQANDEENEDKNSAEDNKSMPPKKDDDEEKDKVTESAATVSGDIETGDESVFQAIDSFAVDNGLMDALEDDLLEKQIANLPADVIEKLRDLANEYGKTLEELVQRLYTGKTIGQIEMDLRDESKGLVPNKDDLIDHFWSAPENKKWLNEQLSRKL